jgi:hypothetical protein
LCPNFNFPFHELNSLHTYFCRFVHQYRILLLDTNDKTDNTNDNTDDKTDNTYDNTDTNDNTDNTDTNDNTDNTDANDDASSNT